jgi:hypothetical protein
MIVILDLQIINTSLKDTGGTGEMDTILPISIDMVIYLRQIIIK